MPGMCALDHLVYDKSYTMATAASAAASSCELQPPSRPILCNTCSKTFQLQQMYACNRGQYMCGNCYRQVYNTTNKVGNPYSVHRCSSMISQSHSKYEKLAPTPTPTIQSSIFSQDRQERDSSVSRVSSYQPEVTELNAKQKRSMFPNPNLYMQEALDNHKSLISVASIFKPSLISVPQGAQASKRPITCPQFECRKTIAVSALDMHFYHEHKQVDTTVSELEERKSLKFDFRELHKQCRSRCLLITYFEKPQFDVYHQINMNGEAESMCTRSYFSFINDPPPRVQRSTASAQAKPKPFFILIVAMLPLVDDEAEGDDDDAETCRRSFKQHQRAFFYLTTNVVGNYCYSLAASAPELNLRVKYFGPLKSVNENLEKLCREGCGLFLNHLQINAFSEGCTRPVNLDLIIHERDDLNFNLQEAVPDQAQAIK